MAFTSGSKTHFWQVSKNLVIKTNNILMKVLNVKTNEKNHVEHIKISHEDRVLFGLPWCVVVGWEQSFPISPTFLAPKSSDATRRVYEG